MQDIMHGYQIGDRVLFDDQDDELGLEQGDEGVVVDIDGNASVVVNFNGKHVSVKWYYLKKWIDVSKLNPREKIKYDYAEWVDEITDICDWKTNITMEEVQSTYSKLAIHLAIRELQSIAEINADAATASHLRNRIKYLEETLNETS